MPDSRASPETGYDAAAIQGWHAHVYYDGESKPRAEAVRAGVAALFPDAVLGRWHDQPIGPHTRGMYQIAFAADRIAPILSWLVLNRQGLAVLLHPMTGRDLSDHSTHAAWLGEILPLNLGILAD